MLTAIKILLANKTLTVILLTWGATSGYNWWSNYQERAEWKRATEIYTEAFMDSQEQLQRNDDVMRKQLISERKRNEKLAGKTAALYKIAQQEIKSGLGGACGPFANIIVPAYYFDGMRLVRPGQAAAGTNSKRTAREWLTDKLQKASGVSKARPDLRAVQNKPVDWLGSAPLHDERGRLFR